MRSSIAIFSLLAATVCALPLHPHHKRLSPDPAGEKNIGNGAGGQFITGQCLSNADCGSGCCATLGNIGICSGPAASTQQGKTGCGFGGGLTGGSGSGKSNTTPPSSGSSATPATGAAASGLKPDPAGVKNIGNGRGGQFITGQCLSNADCASTCCATLPLTDGTTIGICSGTAVGNAQGKQGCGFNSGTSLSSGVNTGDSGKVSTTPSSSSSSSGSVTPATGAAASGLKPDPAGVKNIGNGAGGQFITGQCLSNADCASTCCATLPLTDGTTIGICSGTAVGNAQGKQGCGFSAGTSLSSGVDSNGGSGKVTTNPSSSSGSSSVTPATGAAASGLKPDPAGVKNIGNGNGGQFITGQCLSNADCASTCCATLPLTDGTTIGICSGTAVGNAQGKQGCGFSSGTSLSSGVNTGDSGKSTTSTPSTSSGKISTPATGAASSGLKPDPAGVKNIGNGARAQFITGQCLSNADCASTCCATLPLTDGTTIGICSGTAVGNAQGKQGCGFTL